MSAVPLVGCVILERIFSKVLFPAPLCPMMPEHLTVLNVEGDILQRPE